MFALKSKCGALFPCFPIKGGRASFCRLHHFGVVFLFFLHSYFPFLHPPPLSVLVCSWLGVRELVFVVRHTCARGSIFAFMCSHAHKLATRCSSFGIGRLCTRLHVHSRVQFHYSTTSSSPSHKILPSFLFVLRTRVRACVLLES